MIKEFHKPDGLVIAVYIGSYDQPLDQLLANPQPYLSYVVFINSDGMYVYDLRFRNMYKISICSSDESIVWERLRYDFFVALRNGEHVIIKRGQKLAPALHVLSRFSSFFKLEDKGDCV